MKRITWTWTCVAIAFAVLETSHAADSPAPETTKAMPNILFILTEDQGAHLGCLGTAGLRTPNIDVLARTGMLFRSAFVAYPVCSASKACIYTGLHNHRNGILNNTMNYHKPADKLTPAERNHPLYLRNRIAAEIPTLTELLRSNGYYQGATHKLHVAPVEKFPYDEFLPNPTGRVMRDFLKRASANGRPWFLLYNIPDTHRPYPNSDKVKIRVRPDEVKLPAFLPDTPVVRKDWAEYLASIERADSLVGEALEALRASGQQERTIVVFMGDHGPTFQHGKMTPYDLGLRVPLVIAGPGIRTGATDALASELDLMPTLLDLAGIAAPPRLHGISLRGVLEGRDGEQKRAFVFAEISHKGNLPNDGMQERAIFDGRWKLVYRENTEPPWRQVQADSKQWPTWGNRTYDETVRVKDKFPEAFRVLAGLDPQNLGGKVPALELYDLQRDPNELHDLARSAEAVPNRDRLLAALRQWACDTADPAVQLRKSAAKPGSSAEIVAWQKNLRAKLQKLLKIDDLVTSGAKTPFESKEINVWDLGDYVAKKVTIRSTPGRVITIVITFPKSGAGPYPAVVCIGGHGSSLYSVYANGKPFADWSPKGKDSSPIYKGFASELAKKGYVTISTVVSQHEISEPGHTLMGERLWDLMRCVSYLHTLPEVDKTKIGCGGLSLGGEMTMWLAAMDARIAAADSSGFLTVMDQMEKGHCMCWKFDGLRELVDYADIYALIAPRPLECQNGRKESPGGFTPALAEKAMGEIRPIYASFGKPDNVTLDIHEDGHVIDLSALLTFFDKHLKP